MDSMSELLKDQFFNMHGVPAGADIARYVESEARKWDKPVDVEALQELENKMKGVVSSKYKPELPLHIKYCEHMVNGLENYLKSHNQSKDKHIALIKERDKFVSRFLSENEECRINTYLRDLVKEGKGGMGGIEQILSIKIIHPTETSCNMYNMIKYQPYVYSEHTDIDCASDLQWSGFNSCYKTEKMKINFEKLLYIYIIMEFFSQTSNANGINCYEFVKDHIQNDQTPLFEKDDIKEYADRLFHMYSSQLYEKINKDVGAKFFEISKQISLFIDYSFLFNQVPYISKNTASKSLEEISEKNIIHKFVSLFSKNRQNLIPDLNDIVLVWNSAGDKRLMGFNFKTNQVLQTADDAYKPSRCELLLRQEISFSKLMNEFLNSLSPKQYIITESRPPEKQSLDKHENKSSEMDKQIEQELKLLGKIESDQARREEKSNLIAEKINMNKTNDLYKQQMLDIRTTNLLATIESKKKAQEWSEKQKERENEFKSYNRLANQIERKEKLAERMLSQTKQSMLKLIDDEHKIDMKSSEFKTKLVEQTLKNTHKTRSHLLHLIEKINTKVDKITPDNCQSKQPGFIPSSEILSMDNKITEVTNLYDNLKYLLHSFGIKGEVLDEVSSDLSTVNSNNMSEEETTIAQKISQRVESLILTNLNEWDKDVRSSQERLEDLYRKIEDVLTKVQNAVPVGESLVNYEKENEFIYDDQQQDFDMGDLMLTSDVQNFQDRSDMVAQVPFNIKPKLYSIEDSYKKTVKDIKENLKKTTDLNIILNKQNADLQRLYGEAIKEKAAVSIRFQALEAKYRDVSRINGLVSRAISSDMKKSSSELKNLKDKLDTLLKKMKSDEEEKERKSKSQDEKINQLVQMVKDSMQYMNENVTNEHGIISRIWDNYRVTDIMQSEKHLAKQSLLTDLQRQQTAALDNLKSHQFELEKILSQKAQQPQNTNTVQNAIPAKGTTLPTTTNLPTTEEKEIPKTESHPITSKTETRSFTDKTVSNHKSDLTKHFYSEIERKKIMKKTMDQIDYGNKIYDKINNLKKSGLNGQDLLGVKRDISIQPQIINIPNIFRQAELHGDVNRDDVIFIKTNLQDRWHGIVAEEFPKDVTVNINGVQQIHLDYYFLLRTYVIPCLSILYDDPSVSLIATYDSTLFEFQENLNEIFNKVLRTRCVHDQIYNLVTRYRSKRNLEDEDTNDFQSKRKQKFLLTNHE